MYQTHAPNCPTSSEEVRQLGMHSSSIFFHKYIPNRLNSSKCVMSGILLAQKRTRPQMGISLKIRLLRQNLIGRTTRHFPHGHGEKRGADLLEESDFISWVWYERSGFELDSPSALPGSCAPAPRQRRPRGLASIHQFIHWVLFESRPTGQFANSHSG